MLKIRTRRLSVLVFVLALAFLFGATGCKGGDRGVVESRETERRPESVLDQTQPYLATSDVNVRAGPGTQYAIITRVERGTKVNVLVQEGEWLKVVSRFGRPPGYIQERYLRPVEQEGGLSGSSGPYLTTQDTSVRQGPGFDYRVVAQIPRGTRVHVVGSEGEWLRVESRHGKPPGFIPKRDAELYGRS